MPRRRCHSRRGGLGSSPSSFLLLLLWATASYAQQDGQNGHETETSVDAADVLLKLFQSTAGLRWTERDGWAQSDDFCSYRGVTCYPSDYIDQRRRGHVQQIDLSSNHLVGKVPDEVFTIPYLESLVLRDNADVDVEFARIGEAEFLKELIISDTGVKSLSGIGAATGLEILHVTNLGMTGTFPSEIYLLRNLKGLYANHNSFTGQLSNEIGNLSDLEDLLLLENDLTGQVPSALGNLRSLKTLSLGSNAFGGELPPELGDCASLEVIAVHRLAGSEKGPGISGQLPSLSKLENIVEIYFQNQKLTGPIPSDFLANAPENDVLTVDLTGNNLSGAIPNSLDEKTRMNLLLAGNDISPLSSGFCAKIGGWMGGAVGRIGCNAILCPPKTYAPEGRETDTASCEDCAAADKTGAIECSASEGGPVDERAILVDFYNKMGGQYWQSSMNWLDQGRNICSWEGITCTDDGQVSGISLRNHGLTNTPPEDIFFLPELKTLDLSSNTINFDFSPVGSAAKLEVLDLTQSDIKSLDGIGSLSSTSIRKLSVASNYFQGNLPSALFTLQTLEELDISHNRFTGSLSSAVGQLANLVRLRLYGNELSGQLPAEIGNLVQLVELLAAENNFSGSLPAELNSLSRLENLSIHQGTSSSSITGNLPAFSNLQQLTSLQVYGNALSGSLPDNLLGNTLRGNDEIELLLGDNDFSGSVPSSWGNRFSQLFVDLTGNKISGIPSNLCSQNSWMQGTVGSFNCDGILCPIGTFNELGRMTGSSAACRSCPSAQFMGTKECNGQSSDGEITILTEFFSATNGQNWDVNDGWGTSQNYCSWHGIACNAGGDVVKIDLSSNGLSGTPPPSIFNLRSLTELNLGKNQIAFSFDGISAATRLASLILSETNLDSIVGIGAATSLVELHLTDNDLKGEIPEDIFTLSNLRLLYMNFNYLEGPIPSGISALQHLEELFLFNNRLNGQLPAALGSLRKLRVLALSENNFEGSLPPELEDLLSLEILALQREGGTDGSIQGNIGVNQGKSDDDGPGLTGPLLSFSKMKNLKELYLGINSLSGTIPSNFLDGVEDKTATIQVDLISNKLEGELPSSLARFERMALYVAGNLLSGIPQGLCRRTDWMKGAVGEYDCNAILCPPNTFSEFGREADDASSCVDCPSGSAAPFYGGFKCLTDDDQDTEEERAILMELYDATRGGYWEFSDNWMDPDKSICSWRGITCTGDGSVESIHLMHNGLWGQIPASIYGLPSLKEINFAGNEIQMGFSNIQAASNLEYINVDGTGLRSLNGIQNAPGLKLLHAEDNNFGGIFPDEVFSLGTLEVLYLSGNAFAGSLSSSIGSLSNLVSFSCSGCGLSGGLPTAIGLLRQLEYLRLDKNSFSGFLPSEVQSLAILKHLDVSHQIAIDSVLSSDLSSELSSTSSQAGFSGALGSFSNFTQLSELFLQFNSFTGQIASTFMQAADSSGIVTVDLRGNRLTGALPSSLSRFPSLNLYAADNMITEIPTNLCTMLWNGKTSSDENCDYILCGVNTINGLGRATNALPCISCPQQGDSPYLGGTSCGEDLEREILDEFYRSTGGEEWMNSAGWSTGADVCSRFGVTCDSGLVRSIDLHENNLVGQVPSRIWLLTKMADLDLSQNRVDVSFEQIGNAESLTDIKLSKTNVQSIQYIGGATNLEYLDLASNDIPGPLPDELFNLTNLRSCFLDYNQFSGTLPTRVGDLNSLEELYLFNNNLQGPIPDDIGWLYLLRVLSLGHNKFTGPIPNALSYMPYLEVISLQSEKPAAMDALFALPGGLTGDLPSFHSAPALRELYLGNNGLGGTISADFLAEVNNKGATIHVDISSNAIHGAIPSTLTAFSDLRLNAANNIIDEVPEDICSMTTWMGGLMMSGCDSLLCPPGTYNQYGRRIASEDCQPCDHRGVSLFYGSTFCGAIFPEGLTEREILLEVYDGSGGPAWTDNTGWNDDTISICDWKGVLCEKNNQGDDVVTELDLRSNNLHGTVPSIVFYLPFLRVLNVNGNDVSMVFRDIRDADTLEELLIGSTNVVSLEGIGQASNLRVLSLERNSFFGQNLPEELFTLTALEDLDISHCGFVGTLSSSIGALTRLESFQAINNDLDGAIPESIGVLSMLKSLMLSDNNFYGSLPASLDELTAIETIAIDARTRNTAGLSGALPSFSNLPNLKNLDLGSNSLTATIPTDFLASVSAQGGVINVSLDSNILVGEVPSDLARFDRLNLDVSDNEIESIGDGLCSKSQWWDGDVGEYLCDGLLCPVGTYSALGRQSSAEAKCDECPGESSPYLGRTKCPAIQKAKAKDILELLYQTTGGANWKNNDNWMDSTVDICLWRGVTCRNEDEVESLILGSNNLVGRPPKEIFELPGLRYLWLYSNPIDFSFEGIQKATSLTSIQLDSTGLSSLEGIGEATALVDVDVRFNNLRGPLPDEISKLTNLEAFFCGDNQLSGPLPSFASNRKLTALRVGGNSFSGPLPSFSIHANMKSLDVSDNNFQGAIPDDFFASSDSSKSIFLDLSSNELSGTIPGSLSRFSDVTIYARNNMIEDIHPDLCTQDDWNGGDVGLFGCDGIACPPKTYSVTGRASEAKSQCISCRGAQYFGTTDCPGGASSSAQKATLPTILMITLSCAFIFTAYAE